MRSFLGYITTYAAGLLVEKAADDRRCAGKRKLMFWSLTHRPQDFVGTTIKVKSNDILTAIAVLRSGDVLESYMGWADCRICGARLGTKDATKFGFVWPERAEHYVEVHGVWVPGMDEMLAIARTEAARA